ncbi:unnamed protein product [Cuscuta campestris]|nr:unnamed protein product [Cuscuta campestris]
MLLSYPLQGHVIPSVHLAYKLAENGFAVTFVNTQSVHRHLSKSNANNNHRGGGGDDIFAGIRERAGLNIRYLAIPDGLPVEWDRSENHDQFLAALLHVYSAHVEEALRGLLKSTDGGPPVNCLIADSFFVFPGKLAKKYNLLYISFWTEPALVFTLYYHLHLLRLHGHYDRKDSDAGAGGEEVINYVPGVESIRRRDLMSYLQAKDTATVCHQIIDAAFDDVRDADFVLCNTVHELEPHTIAALEKKMKFYAMGPIFPPAFSASPVATSLWSESDCSRWLGSNPPGSVLYVSFGSYAHLSKPDLLEIAFGLSLSGANFLWALRPDMVCSGDQNPLPPDLTEEISGRGMIVPWCNQKQVLGHPAIGGFLTHCGWNSTLEGIWCHVPLLCFPLLTDQFTNRKLIVDDWKCGLNLCDETPVSRAEISEKVKRIMGGKSSEALRDAVKRVKKTMEDALFSKNGSSQENMGRFIKDVNLAVQNKVTIS